MNAITPEASTNQLAFSFSDTPPARNGKVVKQRNFDLRTKPPVTLTQAQRRAINEQVREILNNGAAGDDDRGILYKFTGEGGLSAGTREALNQHFTDFATIRAIYRALDNAGFHYRKVLEPAAGSGNFVGMRPECDWTTVELDPVCHALLNRLYPDAKHYNISFEQFTAAGFDLVISNVPFSEERGAGSLDTRPDIRTLHDFYVVHALERVKENGLVVFITSTGTMDKVDSAVREEITRQADVLAAFRLPEGHFRKSAHTDVTVDIIFLMKRPAGTEPREENRIINKAFRDVRREARDLRINTCYDLFPDHILGELSVGKGRMRYGKEVYVVKGVADLERIEIDYRPYPVKPDSDTDEKETTEKPSW
ncbi:MAG: N-6 DNA methylase, partial [Candidatus Omnitrophica bacterium]|nr:N-6 DNA methylase [Candidatus Omnitrophota bacterium]